MGDRTWNLNVMICRDMVNMLQNLDVLIYRHGEQVMEYGFHDFMVNRSQNLDVMIYKVNRS